jgi:hypothetical protein
MLPATPGLKRQISREPFVPQQPLVPLAIKDMFDVAEITSQIHTSMIFRNTTLQKPLNKSGVVCFNFHILNILNY